IPTHAVIVASVQCERAPDRTTEEPAMSIARRISLACGFALLTLASCCTTAVTAEEPQSAKEPATEADSAAAPTGATPDQPTATPAEPVPVETTATPVMPVTVVTPRGVE